MGGPSLAELCGSVRDVRDVRDVARATFLLTPVAHCGTAGYLYTAGRACHRVATEQPPRRTDAGLMPTRVWPRGDGACATVQCEGGVAPLRGRACVGHLTTRGAADAARGGRSRHRVAILALASAAFVL